MVHLPDHSVWAVALLPSQALMAFLAGAAVSPGLQLEITIIIATQHPLLCMGADMEVDMVLAVAESPSCLHSVFR